MVQPLKQFACGCSLQTGLKVILALHMAANLWQILIAVLDIILKVPYQIIALDYGDQTVLALIGLMGIPLVLCGYLGVYTEQEQPCRIYLYYCLLWFIADLACLTYCTIVFDPCGHMPGASGSSSQHKGSSQICGYIRAMLLGTAVLFSLLFAYLIFVIWSYCEVLRAGGTGYGLPALVQGKQVRSAHKSYSAAGIFGTGRGTLQPVIPVVYGSIATPGAMGGVAIFNGKKHQTDFPPRPPSKGDSAA